MTATLSSTEGRPRQVGKVLTRITISNHTDVSLAKRSGTPDAPVRQIELDGVLVDTGATLLSLPKSMIEDLGLDMLEEVIAETATGTVMARIFSGASLTVEGRTRTVDVLELPGGGQPLLGVIPLELLGIELDLQKQRLVLLPDHGPGTYITAY